VRLKMVAEMLITSFGRGVNEGKSEEAMEASWRKGEGMIEGWFGMGCVFEK
jgi:hypothetical protein